MKKSVAWVAIVLSLCLPLLFQTKAETHGLNLAELTLAELKQLQSDISREKEIHHRLNSSIENEILNKVKKSTEDYYAEHGITVSWPRFGWDYSYSRDTDFFKFSTYLNYRDDNNRNQRVDVAAELYYDGISYKLYRLYLNDETIVSDSYILPEGYLINEKNAVINKATGLNLSLLSLDELNVLERDVKSEIDINHTVRNDSRINDILKKAVESYFTSKNVTPISWPWFDYDYTCDWDCYTEKTRISYTENKEKHNNVSVYAEIYLVNGEYSVYYLKIGDEVIYDNRQNVKSENVLLFLNNRMYETACQLFETNKYDEARDLFESLGSFKNSAYYWQCCLDSINQIDYNEAIALMESGSYDEAASAFDRLGDYSDSVKKAAECREAVKRTIYDDAIFLADTGDYELAITRFSEIPEYQDSEEKIKECETAIIDNEYKRALDEIAATHYEEAIEILSQIIDYKDSEQRIAECQEAILERQYKLAVSKMNEGLYSEAIELFGSLNGYSDSEAKIEECKDAINQNKYEQAESFVKQGKYSEAKTIFLELGNYSDSPERLAVVQGIIESLDREIILSAQELVLFQETKSRLEPTVKPLTETANKNTTLVFSSSNPDVAMVSKNGTITAGKLGNALIRCEVADNPYIFAEVTVNVVKSISKVTISTKKIDLSIPEMNGNSKGHITVNVEPQDAHLRTGKWTSSKESVATVDQDGNINAVGIGAAVITFTADDTSRGKKTVTCNVNVTQAVTSIDLPESSGIVYVGKQNQLKPTINPKNAANKKLTWKSSDETIATVNVNGQIKGVGVGEAIITATSADGPSASYKATVKIAPVTLKISYSAKCIAKNHVGSNWSKEFYLNGETVKGTGKVTVENGDTISVGCLISENDKWPDQDGFDKKIQITPEIMTKGITIKETVYVTENGGRYSGCSAEWSVVITIKP